MTASVALDSLVGADAPICYGILKPGPHVSDGIPVVKVRNYNHSGIDLAGVLRTAPEIDSQYRRSRLRAGDIVMSIRGTTGIVAIVPPELDEANITQDTARIRVAPIERDYLYQALHAPFVVAQIRLHTIGQAVQGINIASVRKLQIPWPEPETRRLIARVLKDCDAQRRQLAALVDAKRTLKRGLIAQLLTGQKRFPDFVKSSERHPGEFGTVPADWNVVKISEIAEEVKTRGPVKGSLVYSCTKHRGLVPSLEYFGKQVFSENLDSYKRLNPGDFAYATNHIEEGSIGLLRAGQPAGVVSPMYTVFRVGPKVASDFLFALLKTESYRRVFEKRTSASVDRRGSLRWHEFARIKIGLPSLEEQSRIAATSRLMDDELEQLSRLGKSIEMEKRALLLRLLSDGRQVASL